MASAARHSTPGPGLPLCGASPARSIRLLGTADAGLASVNRIVSAASLAWNLPPRLRRLALPTLLYDETDLRQMSVALAAHDGEPAVGVALWEEAGAGRSPRDSRSALLHGLYVIPRLQRRGLGAALLDFVENRAAGRTCERVVLRAWRSAEPFFMARGYCPQAPDGSAELYPRRLWRSLR